MPVSMWVIAQDKWALSRGKNGATRSAGTDCAMNLDIKTASRRTEITPGEKKQADVELKRKVG